MKEWKRPLLFANTCISSGDIQVWKMCNVCKWDDWWCHTLNPILHHLCKWSYLCQFAAQIIETWQTNSSIENTPKAIKHFVAMATQSFPVHTHLISICKLFSARKTLHEATNSSLTYLYACWIMHLTAKNETFLIQIGWDIFFHHIWSKHIWRHH